tara:strand:- start:117 stop:626 length:510 start_codon:yes stop_codon:yes gene_type:complete
MLKKRFFTFFIILLFYQGNLYAKNNIAYMDFNYIINNSNIGKKVLKKLNELNEKNIKDLKQEQDLLRNEIEEINKIKNIASKEDINKKLTLHKQNIKDFDLLKKKLSNDLNQTKESEMKNLIKLINPLLEIYMEENSIDIIFNKEIVYFAKDQYDISKSILELTNNKYK